MRARSGVLACCAGRLADGMTESPLNDLGGFGGSHQTQDLRSRSALYDRFTRREWSALGAEEQLDISDRELSRHTGINERLSASDIRDIFIPLCRLVGLSCEVQKAMRLKIESALLCRERPSAPFIIAIAGSVAVGKSSFSRILRDLLARGSVNRKVDLVATDGFLLPTEVLTGRELMARKGFPETYNLKDMLRFLADLKAGMSPLKVPLYSHESYDIVPNEFQVIDRPDILIFEGLNVLQTGGKSTVVASDYFDFSIYLDGDASVIEEWYVERLRSPAENRLPAPNILFPSLQRLDPRGNRGRRSRIVALDQSAKLDREHPDDARAR